MASLIQSLDRRNWRVVAVTNAIPSHVELLAKMGIYASVDGLYASYDLGLAKPDLRFFQAVLDNERVERGLLIDDTPAAIDAARGVGIVGHLFSATTTVNDIESWLSRSRHELALSGE